LRIIVVIPVSAWPLLRVHGLGCGGRAFRFLPPMTKTNPAAPTVPKRQSVKFERFVAFWERQIPRAINCTCPGRGNRGVVFSDMLQNRTDIAEMLCIKVK
jgi:hypothetical protein